MRENTTEQKKAIEALHESERRLKEAEQVAHLGHWELDLVSNNIHWSDEVYRIFELRPQEFNGTYKAFLGVIHPEDRERVDKAYTDSVKNKTLYDIDHRLLMKDGTVKYVNEKCKTVYDKKGNPLSSLGTVYDITKRKRAEGALKESEERYRALIESSYDCICHIDLDGKINYMNTGGVMLNELDSPDELIGKDCKVGINAEYKDAMGEAIAKARRGESANLEYISINAKGKEIWWESIVGPIKDYKGNVISIVRISRDITDRKDAENTLKRYSMDLEESNKLKDLFIDIMRHDLLNPATVVKGLARLGLDTEKDPTNIEIFRTIERSNRRIIDLIENASKLATLETGDMLELKDTDLGPILKSVVEELTPIAKKKKITLTVQTDGRYNTMANPLIHDVFSNLVDNAIKYGSENSEVIIGIEGNSPNWKISVSDKGENIPDEDKEEIFTRFKRAHKGAVKGTGLGLAIVKKLVESHNGKVWVEDNPRGGSIFYVTLPKKMHNTIPQIIF